MNVRFDGGPYDGVVLQLQEGLTTVRLPVDVTPAIGLVEPKTYRCQAEYTKGDCDDFRTVFIFQGMSAP